jgi:hypothetical protein
VLLLKGQISLQNQRWWGNHFQSPILINTANTSLLSLVSDSGDVVLPMCPCFTRSLARLWRCPGHRVPWSPRDIWTSGDGSQFRNAFVSYQQ